MKSGTTWSITDLDEDARDAAIAAARRAGMSVNDWLNQAVARRVAEEIPARQAPDQEGEAALLAVAESVSELTRRIRSMDSSARTGIAGLKGRLGEIEENLGRAAEMPGERRQRSLKGVSALVDRLNREIDNVDESARSQIEGLRSRAAAYDRNADFGELPEPRMAARARSAPPADATLEDLRERLDALLARGADVSRPIQAPPSRLDTSLRNLEDRLEHARSRLNTSTAIPQPPSEAERMRRIDEQLSRIGGRLAEAEAPAAPVVPPVMPPVGSLVRDELSEAIAEIAMRQRALDERAETASMRRDQKMIADSIATLRSDVAGLVARISAMGKDGAEDKEAWFNLARRIEALAAETPVDRTMLAGIRSEIDALRAISETTAREHTLTERLDDLVRRVPDRGRFDALGEEVSALRRAVETADSPKAIGRLEMRVSELGRSVEAALNSRQAMVDTSAASLGAGLADLRAAVEELSAASHGLARETAVSEISTSLEDIRYALDSLGQASRQNDAGLAASLVEHVAGRLDEIRSSLDAQEAVVRAASADHASHLEARFDELAVRIDGIMDRAASADIVNGLHDRLEALVGRLDAVTAPRADAAMTQIAEEIAAVRAELAARAEPRTDFIESQIHDLADRVDHMARHAPNMASLEALHREIAALRSDITGRHAADVDHLEAEIGDLNARLTDFAQWVPEMASFDQLREDVSGLRSEFAERAPATDRLEAEIRSLAERLDAASRPGVEAEHVADLEAQVARLAAELDRVMPHGTALAAVEADLGRLRNHLAESRTESADLARRAARDVVSEELAGKGIDAGLIESLRRDLDHVRAAVGETDRKSGQTLQSLHGTLAGIVNRLTQLETETERAASAASAPQAKPVLTAVAPAQPEPRTAAPVVTRPFMPRRAEEVAAESRATEPAAEKPDLAALRELAASAEEVQPERPAAARRADFIAAARRAAQAAVAEAAAAPSTAEPQERSERGEARPGAFARIGQAIRSRKKPLLLAAAAIVLAIGSLYVYGPEFGASPSRPQTAKTETPAAPAVATAKPASDAVKAVLADTSAAIAKVVRPPLGEASGGAKAAMAMPAEPVTSAFGAAPAAPPAETFTKAAEADPAPAVPVPAPAVPDVIKTVADAAPASAIPAVAAATDSVGSGAIGSDKLRSAAAAGDPAAAFEVATRYAEGRGVVANLATAAGWYERAAEGGIAVAQYRLGSLYERGQGVKKDLTKAVNWYQRAADQGNVGAMHNLAVLMSEGVDGQPDPAKALQWFLAAGNYGVKDSQYNLGVIYARGIGTQRDMSESYKWFAIAAAQGDKDAASRRDEVASLLSPDQLSKARAAVSAWKPKPSLAEANVVAAPAGGWDGVDEGVTAADQQALVKKIQALLTEQGYDVGTPDGVVGPRTRDAVKAYQRSIGAAETGQIDQRLVASLADR
jgi:localization factor PodJL